MTWGEKVAFYAQRFKNKVERDAPACFTPSRELQDLFDILEMKE